jgi:hypothetical protein
MEYPKCPHCSFEFTDDHIWRDKGRCEFPTEDGGDTSEFECPACLKGLFVTLETTPKWSFQDSDGMDLT